MAKRKRLTPAQAGFLSGPAPEVKSAVPPIAQVAGEAAAASALSTLSGEWETARAEGRLILTLDLGEIDANHLVRDRASLDEEALESLKQSLMARGQQTPIEVSELGQGRYGLISGWRRLTALRQLHDETGEARFAQVAALLRRPTDLAESYVAMVEENEIRSDLSFYERARIVIKSLEEGVFESEKAALNALFSTGSYARRSKIKSFLLVVRALDGTLRFPTRMSERTGLAVSKVLTDPVMEGRFRQALLRENPADADAETACLMAVLETQSPATPKAKAAPKPVSDPKDPPRIEVVSREGEILLRGPDVTPDFLRRLEAWLQKQG